jgi:CcmD family protein
VGNEFLVLAYGFLWLIFILYAWNIARRQARLRQRLEELRGKMQDQLPPDSPCP